MNENLTPPVPGEPMSAARFRQLYQAVRSQRLAVLPPLRMTQGPDGTTLRLSADGGTALAAGDNTAWAVASWDGDSVTLRNCILMRGTATLGGPGMERSATLGGSSGWLCGRLDTSDNTLSLHWGAPPASLEPDSEFVTFPLYFLRKTGGAWTIELDARAMPRLGIYQ